jgi:hypothetical protein
MLKTNLQVVWNNWQIKMWSSLDQLLDILANVNPLKCCACCYIAQNKLHLSIKLCRKWCHFLQEIIFNNIQTKKLGKKFVFPYEECASRCNEQHIKPCPFSYNVKNIANFLFSLQVNINLYGNTCELYFWNK